jgi:dTMP kinase
VIGRGKLITLEGIEGAGKSTQIEQVRDCLVGQGIRVILTREPGGSRIAERIRDVLLDPACGGMATDAELLLVFAARAEHLAHKILPALEAGTWVVCDLPVQEGLARAGRRSQPDRFESETVRFFEDVRTAYLALAARHPARIRTLDASASQVEVATRVRALVHAFVGQVL